MTKPEGRRWHGREGRIGSGVRKVMKERIRGAEPGPEIPNGIWATNPKRYKGKDEVERRPDQT